MSDTAPGRARDERGLIWTRDDVIATSATDLRTSLLTHYLKVIETDEIFELGEVEHEVWQQFRDGQTLEAAERDAAARHGEDFRKVFRGLVAELAIRGLLRGAIPVRLLHEYRLETGDERLRYQIDPNYKDPDWPYYRIELFDPDPVCSRLARWFWFAKYLIWPILFFALVGGMVLIKHSAELSADSPPELLSQYGIPHFLFTLFTLNFLRNIVMGAVIRHFGGRMRYFSLDFRFGFFPRFRADKRGMFRLKRTPQLWAHSSPFFIRMAFFGLGAIAWWTYRGDGTIRSSLGLIACQAGLVDLLISALPIFKSETYYWFCAYFEEPFLRERALAALRGLFSRARGPFDVPPVERTALIAYGVSFIASGLLIAYSIVNIFMAWTGKLRGTGFALYLTIVLLVLFYIASRLARVRNREAQQAERRARRRQGRRGSARLSPSGEG
jgi:hypothetical protein